MQDGGGRNYILEKRERAAASTNMTAPLRPIGKKGGNGAGGLEKAEVAGREACLQHEIVGIIKTCKAEHPLARRQPQGVVWEAFPGKKWHALQTPLKRYEAQGADSAERLYGKKIAGGNA